MRHQALGEVLIEHLPRVFALEPDRKKAVGVRPYGHFISLSQLLLGDPRACQLFFYRGVLHGG